MPDDALRALADNATILEKDVLLAQTRRMLNDERSNEFVAGFTDERHPAAGRDQQLERAVEELLKELAP